MKFKPTFDHLLSKYTKQAVISKNQPNKGCSGAAKIEKIQEVQKEMTILLDEVKPMQAPLHRPPVSLPMEGPVYTVYPLSMTWGPALPVFSQPVWNPFYGMWMPPCPPLHFPPLHPGWGMPQRSVS